MNTIERPPEPPAISAEETAVVRKAAGKILPLVFLCYVVSYLDRSNIGVAALTMMASLGLDAAQFGLAAGIFFVGYIAGSVPANLLQVRYGARAWMGRILIAWGIVACAMAAVTGPHSLYALRILLGLAEAGFVPGAVTYLAFWFPAAYRTRAFAFFSMAIPGAMVIGSPLSAALLYMDGIAGLHGWQWLFVIEGLPAVVLGIVCLRYLPDSPREARWLDPREREVLEAALEREFGTAPPPSGAGTVRAALTDRHTWNLGLMCIGLGSGSYGVVFFLPQIIAGFGVTHLETGLLSALPFLVALAVMYFWSSHSDRTGERRMHIGGPLLAAAAGLAVAATVRVPTVEILALIVVAAGVNMATPPFFRLIPDYFVKGTYAATATATILTMSSLAGFLLPSLIGYLKLLTGDFRGGLLCAAGLTAVAGTMALRLPPPGPRQT